MCLVEAFSLFVTDTALPDNPCKEPELLKLFLQRLRRIAVFNALLRACEPIVGRPRLGTCVIRP